MKNPFDPQSLHDKWGMIAERIASDPDLVAAIVAVLGFEQDVLNDEVGVHKGTDPAIAHVINTQSMGQKDGLDLAFRALCDNDYIRERRGQFHDQLSEDETSE